MVSFSNKTPNHSDFGADHIWCWLYEEFKSKPELTAHVAGDEGQ